MFGRETINDPYDTMGTGKGTSRREARPGGAATRDTDRRKSSWLVTRRLDHPDTEACKTCKGTGSSGWKDDQGRTIVCETCRGFGY